MVNSFSITNQTLATNELISFANNRLATSCSISHPAGSTSFTIKRPGLYIVSFHGVASATAAATEPITVQLLNKGVEVQGALASELSAAADTPVNLSFTTAIQVRPSCCAIDNEAILTFENAGIEALFSNVEVVITTIC
jgi:hypothetical protein